MQLTADFTYYTTHDSLIGTGTNNEFCVGPGQTAVLRSGYVDSDHKLARSAYKLRALHAGESTADKYEVEELETKEDELKIKVTNTSDKTLSFFSGPQWWGTDSAGKVAAGVGEFANDKTELKPGESVDVLFKRDKILDKDTFGAWEDYKRTYCLLGRANNPE